MVFFVLYNFLRNKKLKKQTILVMAFAEILTFAECHQNAKFLWKVSYKILKVSFYSPTLEFFK